jgi:Ni,Fe-hydrogenase III small subunit
MSIAIRQLFLMGASAEARSNSWPRLDMPTVFLATGPVTVNMREALLKTYEATAETKTVIASRSCATPGGIFKDHLKASRRDRGFFGRSVRLRVPPAPLYDPEGLLRLLGRH